MADFGFEPPLPASATAADGFVQTITLREGKQILGSARWHASGDLSQGVVQILDLTIAEPHRRRGNGGRLLKCVIEQAIKYHRLHKKPLRRIWLSVEQKSQVIGRAFLTQHGFHHTSTISDLLKGQDALIYVRAMD